MDNTRLVVLVDRADTQVGTLEIVAAHTGLGVLHRAVSVFLYKKTDSGLLTLIQKRSAKKLLWPHVWSNTVCTHPFVGEQTIDCAVRRLEEEVGVNLKPDNISFVTKLLYQARYNDSLSEHELDSIFVGEWNGAVVPHKDEVEQTKWIGWIELLEAMKKTPSDFTPWFKQLVTLPEFIRALPL